MKNIQHKQEILISTEQLAQVAGTEHRTVTRLLQRHSHITSSKVERVQTSGRPYTVAYLTPRNALKLIAHMSGQPELKDKMVNAFESGSVVDTLLQLIASLDVADLPADRFVYVARERESGRYKIGISKDPIARVVQLNIGNPEELDLVHYYKATESGYQSETLAHALYAEYRIRSEWFESGIDLNLLPQDLAKIMGKSPVALLTKQ